MALYSRTLLRYDDPVALDGVTTELVEAKVKDIAAKRLAQLSARKTTQIPAKDAATFIAKPAAAPPQSRQPYAIGRVPRSRG